MSEQVCNPSSYLENNFSTVCQYVQRNTDLCEGGGYILWSELKVCADSPFLELVVVILSLVFFIYLFVLLSTTADDFFCANIACIIDHHQISQNIAGITIMAFGNGSSDIFSSIASVISVKNPQAGLAISELLGGGIFITTIVISAIILSTPFNVMRRPVIRDVLFYLLALSMLIFVVLYDNEIHVWQPCMFLLLYIIYAFTVISGNLVRQRLRKNKRKSKLLTKAILKVSGILPKKPKSGGAKVAPIASIAECVVVDKKQLAVNGLQGLRDTQLRREDSLDRFKNVFIVTPASLDLGGKLAESTTAVPAPKNTLVIPINEKDKQRQGEVDEYTSANDYLEAGKFFVKEELDNEDEEQDSVTTSSSLIVLGENKEKVIVAAASEIKREMAASSSCSSTSTSYGQHSKKRILKKFGKHMSPLDVEEFHQARWFFKIYHLFKIPCMIFLKISVPLATAPWYKPLVVVHAFVAPLVLCAAFKILRVPLIPNGPIYTSSWVLALAISTTLSLLVILFTKYNKQPKYYKQLASYAGFVMSIAWIYGTASEIVNVVLMFGNLFGISYQILGLTAVSWCNSVGDMIADVSVARQGFPRMAFSAAIGGPLFNLLVGFGSTMLIAKLQGKTVGVKIDGVKTTMFITLAVSLISTLFLLFFQRFQLRRPHGVYLIVLYVVFLAFALLVNQKVI